MKPNYEKCTVLHIESLRGSNFEFCCDLPVKWSDGPIDVLGIHVPRNMEHITIENFERKLLKSDRLLKAWRMASLTVYGKIIVLNSLVIPQFVYILMALPSPKEDLFKKYERMVFVFFM